LVDTFAVTFDDDINDCLVLLMILVASDDDDGDGDDEAELLLLLLDPFKTFFVSTNCGVKFFFPLPTAPLTNNGPTVVVVVLLTSLNIARLGATAFAPVLEIPPLPPFVGCCCTCVDDGNGAAPLIGPICCDDIVLVAIRKPLPLLIDEVGRPAFSS
jgi:hypothetical protein